MKTIRLLFNDDMARAIVQGRKTVTRRPVTPGTWNPNGPEYTGEVVMLTNSDPRIGTQAYFRAQVEEWHGVRLPCAPGDLLIGRECWRVFGGLRDVRVDYRAGGASSIIEREVHVAGRAFVHYLPDVAQLERTGSKWHPSIHMPDWAARIRRRVVSVTMERLQAITEEDAVREGYAQLCLGSERGMTAREVFATAWETLYAPKGLGWTVNPWAWRIEFNVENVQ